MKHEITLYGNMALRRKSEPVTSFDQDLRDLSQDLLDTMYASHGLGLAAEQIGRRESVCVVDVPADYEASSVAGSEEGNPDVMMPMILVNPEVIDSEGKIVAEEGCLSFPEIYSRIARPEVVTVRYQELSGAQREVRVRGLLARAVQHEIDHLNAILLVDRMSPVQKVAASGRLKRLKKRGKVQS